METIDETPGNLIKQNTHTTSECTRQVKPSHIERILGIKIAATAQMKIEYIYWLKQTIELASRIHRAPLLRIETDAAYRHWIPISSYCLPITIFTPRQAAKLTSPVYQTLLPPLKYNRNTPHAVLYGTLKYGGASRYHLYSAQGLQHIYRIIEYIRQAKNIARLYIIERNLIQLYSGSGEPILTTNYKRFLYATNTCITYLWKFLNIINSTLHVSASWIPPIIRQGD